MLRNKMKFSSICVKIENEKKIEKKLAQETTQGRKQKKLNAGELLVQHATKSAALLLDKSTRSEHENKIYQQLKNLKQKNYYCHSAGNGFNSFSTTTKERAAKKITFERDRPSFERKKVLEERYRHKQKNIDDRKKARERDRAERKEERRNREPKEINIF